MQDMDFTLLTLGSLPLPHKLSLDKRLAGKVPHDTPILTCPMDAENFKLLQNQRATSCFGYGSIKFEDVPILTIRLQLGHTQIYWLADVTDEQVWRTMDKWHKQRFVSHALIVRTPDGETAALGKSPITGNAPITGRLRSHISARAPADMWDRMATLAASGIVQLQATTDIPHIRLQRILVNVLVTKRYEGILQGLTLSQKPVLANGGSAGASKVH